MFQEDRDRLRGVGVRGYRADPDRLAGRLRRLSGQRPHVGHVPVLREGQSAWQDGMFLPAARNEHAGLHFTWALLEEKEEEVWRGTFCE